MTTHAAAIEACTEIDSPLGTLMLAATAHGLAAVLFEAQKHHPGPIDAPDNPAQRHLAQAARELAEYFDGRRRRFDVAVDAHGTAFQRTVWQALGEIECGGLRSYGDIARRVGRPAAARAVGAAIGRNPVAIVVPCHRVVGSAGALTGFAAGLPRKRALLALEGVCVDGKAAPPAAAGRQAGTAADRPAARVPVPWHADAKAGP